VARISGPRYRVFGDGKKRLTSIQSLGVSSRIAGVMETHNDSIINVLENCGEMGGSGSILATRPDSEPFQIYEAGKTGWKAR
jgi:hypothetical protein